MYAPIEATNKLRANGHDGVTREKREEYARKVVKEIMGGEEGKMWCGAMAESVRFGRTFVTQGVLVGCLLCEVASSGD